LTFAPLPRCSTVQRGTFTVWLTREKCLRHSRLEICVGGQEKPLKSGLKADVSRCDPSSRLELIGDIEAKFRCGDQAD
jgi:hypothetical protein